MHLQVPAMGGLPGTIVCDHGGLQRINLAPTALEKSSGEHGGLLVLASDGVWDALPVVELSRTMRELNLQDLDDDRRSGKADAYDSIGGGGSSAVARVWDEKIDEGEEGEEEESCARRVTFNNGRANGSSRGASLYSNGSGGSSSRSSSGRTTATGAAAAAKQSVSVPVRADTALALKARALVQEAVEHECWGLENPHVSTTAVAAAYQQ
jgi:hypothetical protein